MCQLGCVNEIIIITVEIIFRFSVAFVPATQRRNEVEVSGGVCDVVRDASALKTSQKHIGRRDCTAQAVHCALLSLHHTVCAI